MMSHQTDVCSSPYSRCQRFVNSSTINNDSNCFSFLNLSNNSQTSVSIDQSELLQTDPFNGKEAQDPDQDKYHSVSPLLDSAVHRIVSHHLNIEQYENFTTMLMSDDQPGMLVPEFEFENFTVFSDLKTDEQLNKELNSVLTPADLHDIDVILEDDDDEFDDLSDIEDDDYNPYGFSLYDTSCRALYALQTNGSNSDTRDTGIDESPLIICPLQNTHTSTVANDPLDVEPIVSIRDNPPSSPLLSAHLISGRPERLPLGEVNDNDLNIRDNQEADDLGVVDLSVDLDTDIGCSSTNKVEFSDVSPLTPTITDADAFFRDASVEMDLKTSDKNERTSAPSSPPATPIPVYDEEVSFPTIKQDEESKPVDESMLFEGDTMTELLPKSSSAPKQHKPSQSPSSSPSTSFQSSPLPPPSRCSPPLPSTCITLPSLKQLESQNRTSSERSSSLLIRISGLSKSESERAIFCYKRPASSSIESERDNSNYIKSTETTADKNPTKTESEPETTEPPSPVQPVRRSTRHKTKRKTSNYWTISKPNKRRKKHSHSHDVEPSEFRYACDQCEKTFRQKSQWKRHVDCVHLKIAKFECEKCGKLFKRTDHLKNHLQRLH
ncbi:unnamed protein product [Ambrosiozyma monospora]|uniref:Unnamed protein product n=1 Tax=Ambrosiozyma monospora TaxID=43982 RepID=A0A9W7DBQ2_AMBMO|nr:unnamed protein product [Ambrosiozyma monospora]